MVKHPVTRFDRALLTEQLHRENITILGSRSAAELRDLFVMEKRDSVVRAAKFVSAAVSATDHTSGFLRREVQTGGVVDGLFGHLHGKARQEDCGLMGVVFFLCEVVEHGEMLGCVAQGVEVCCAHKRACVIVFVLNTALVGDMTFKKIVRCCGKIA